MLLYIINSTCIWLIALLAYDLLLKKEATHAYNRLYLLLALAAGALIPLWSWDNDAVIYSTNVTGQLAEQTGAIQQTLQSEVATKLLNMEDALLIVYLAGIAVSMILLLKDIIIITRLYRNGVKSKDGTWVIIETGQPGVPFSAFRYVFISSKEDYTEDELQMILSHEEHHGHMLHVADVLLARLVLIIFWFNPVVYLLEKRLRMVHEYQVDASVQADGATYGKFLVEQSVLHTAPRIAHSFTSSPLKNRLIMLTRKTNRTFSGKQLIIVPVMTIAVLCFTNNAFSDDKPQKDGNKITYKGNVIEYAEEETRDTMIVTEAITGEEQIVVSTRAPRPMTINQEQIYIKDELYGKRNYRTPGLTESVIREYLLTNMGKEIKNLPDGEYTIYINDVIVDKKGKVVFFKFGGVHKMVEGKDGVKRPELIDQKINEKIARKTSMLLEDAPAHNPALAKGKEVYSIVHTEGAYEPFFIENKKLKSL